MHVSGEEGETKKERLPIAQKSLKVDDHLLLLVREVTTFDPWSQIICPSKPATLTTSEQPWNKQKDDEELSFLKDLI